MMVEVKESVSVIVIVMTNEIQRIDHRCCCCVNVSGVNVCCAYAFYLCFCYEI